MVGRPLWERSSRGPRKTFQKVLRLVDKWQSTYLPYLPTKPTRQCPGVHGQLLVGKKGGWRIVCFELLSWKSRQSHRAGAIILTSTLLSKQRSSWQPKSSIILPSVNQGGTKTAGQFRPCPKQINSFAMWDYNLFYTTKASGPRAYAG